MATSFWLNTEHREFLKMHLICPEDIPVYRQHTNKVFGLKKKCIYKDVWPLNQIYVGSRFEPYLISILAKSPIWDNGALFGKYVIREHLKNKPLLSYRGSALSCNNLLRGHPNHKNTF